jgi:hypothetical protein
MYFESDAFRHDWHTSPAGADLRCFECHDKNQSKGAQFKNVDLKQNFMCGKCHKTMIPPDSRTPKIKTYITLSYTDALHNLCINCHLKKIRSNISIAARKPNLAKCSACHKDFKPYQGEKRLFRKRKDNIWVVVPNNNF